MDERILLFHQKSTTPRPPPTKKLSALTPSSPSAAIHHVGPLHQLCVIQKVNGVNIIETRDLVTLTVGVTE